MTTTDITTLIGQIQDPDLGRPLSSLGAIHNVEVDGSAVRVFLEVVLPVHWVARRLDHDITSTILANYPDAEVEVMVRETGLPTTPRSASIAGVKNLIAVASGKGGVGKSTMTANLAAALIQQGATVGILDADVYGPSQPTMYGMAGESMRAEKTDDGKIIGYPNEQYGVKVASIGFVMQRDQAAILRGPMLAGYFSTLVDQIQWGDLDFLLFDLPPGTGDIQLTMTQRIPLTGAVVITTPQEIALADVRRSIQMFNKVNVNVLGVIENMSYFIPPDAPEKRYHIFGEGGGRSIAAEYHVPLLGEVPIDTRIRMGADEGVPFVLDPESGALADAFRTIAANVVKQTRLANSASTSNFVEIQL
jgi:ATP-binding protein involved in chromosome partitioning